MTPDEAREHLAWPEGKDHPKVRDGSGQTWFEVQAGESHPYWNRLPDAPYEDAVMYAVARAALTTIAGMRPEYAVQVLRSGEWQFSRGEDDFRWQDLPVQMVRADRDHPGEETRIVRRYVTEPEEA